MECHFSFNTPYKDAFAKIDGWNLDLSAAEQNAMSDVSPSSIDGNYCF